MNKKCLPQNVAGVTEVRLWHVLLFAWSGYLLPTSHGSKTIKDRTVSLKCKTQEFSEKLSVPPSFERARPHNTGL